MLTTLSSFTVHVKLSYRIVRRSLIL